MIKEISKVEKLLFSSILLFLPVNLAKHFFFDFAYVDGILVDYLIPTVYLTDILIWGLLGFWGFRAFRRFWGISPNHLTIQQFNNPLIFYSSFFILVSSLSVFQALNQPVAVYRWLKLVEYILFAFYVSKHIDLKKDFPTVVKLLSIGVLFESVLVIAQWFREGSIFGYWFFGENKYTVSTPGIAILDFTGIRKVRPYGTFPHPNVLGGYLAVVLPWILYEFKRRTQNTRKLVTSYWLLVTSCSAVALLLSFSRSAWIVGALGVLATFFFTSLHPYLFTISFIAPPSSLLTTLSFLRRAELNWIALEMIKKQPLLGVGLNNFTVRMSEYGEVSGWTRFLQPVHNVYLLIAAEIGLIGLVVFLGLLSSAFRLLLKKKNYLLLISMTQIILLCFVDHYFFTIQQPSLLFWLVVGLVFLEYNQKGNGSF